MDKQHKVDGNGDAIMAVPISFIAPQESKADVSEKQEKSCGEGDEMKDVFVSFMSPQGHVVDLLGCEAIAVDVISYKEDVEKHTKSEDKGKAIIPVSISCVPLQECKVDAPHQNEKSKKVVEMIPKNMHYLHTLTFEQRKQNWIIENRSRPDGLRMDYFYHHLETKEMFRSLTEVYKFVVFGEIPERQIKKANDNGEILQVPKRKPLVRGEKLIKHYVVGTYEPVNGFYVVNRGEVNYMSERDSPSNFEKKRKRANEDLYGHQQVNSGDDGLSAPVKSFLYLWDFELIPETVNAKLA